MTELLKAGAAQLVNVLAVAKWVLNGWQQQPSSMEISNVQIYRRRSGVRLRSIWAC
ncbi:hypothetical protein [Jeongeupia sp. HS-3]|uniref:hypothetical protein n=1 Tax=Jeongeupia sp. HS-3 TaxID=1009682 RepID=UPI00191093A4|nr:hypothetical protein [Jeongeupia sp. HS-3]